MFKSSISVAKSKRIPAGYVPDPECPDQMAKLADWLLQETALTKERRRLGHFIPFHSNKWREFFGGDYKRFKEAAIRSGLIDCNERFSTGVDGKRGFPKGIRLRVEHRTGKTIVYAQRRQSRSKPGRVLDQSRMKQVGIDLHANLPHYCLPVDVQAKTDWESLQFSRMRNGEFYSTRCEFGRFHSTITGLRKSVRLKLTTLSKEPLSFLDVKNAQPLIIGSIARSQYGTGSRIPICCMLVDRRECLDDIDLWIALCELGEIYEFVLRCIKEKPIAPYWVHTKKKTKRPFLANVSKWQKKQVKKAFIACMFDRVDSMKRNPVFPVLDKHFPTIARYMIEAKAGKYQALAHDCQRKESTIMIDGAAAKLMCEHPDAKPTTVHDELICPTRLDGFAKELIIAEFQEYGVTPSVEVKTQEIKGTRMMIEQHEIEIIDIDSVYPSPENDELYGAIDGSDNDLISLANDIIRNGIREPIQISQDSYIVSGHRRFAASKLGKLESIKVRRLDNLVWSETDSESWKKVLRAHNHQRVKPAMVRMKEALLDIDPDIAHNALVSHRDERDRDAPPQIEITGKKTRSQISQRKQEFLRAAIDVIEQLKPFWPVTVRQVHYGLLNNPPLRNSSSGSQRATYENDAKSYDDLTDLLTRARLSGLVSWESISDETRSRSGLHYSKDAATFVDIETYHFLRSYRRDLLQSQPDHVELILEKLTVQGIIEPIASKFCVPMTVGRGYCSIDPRHDIVMRFRKSGKDRLKLLIASDFDPDGEEIAESFARSIRDDFDVDGVTASKILLRQDQIADWNLPHNGMDSFSGMPENGSCRQGRASALAIRMQTHKGRCNLQH